MNKRYTILPVVILSILMASCVSTRKQAYVQDSESTRFEQEQNMYFIDEPEDNLIKSGDELYVKVSSADEGRTAFNAESQSRIYDPTVISHTVNEEGTIKLPYIGEIKLSGLNLMEASDKMEKELAQYLYTPSVFVRFVNNKVTILGEVNNPGVYVFNYKNINILQAIGYAGDVGHFGNRKKVLIIRDEGEYSSKEVVNLLSDELLISKYYLVKSGDVIYIEPLASKKMGMQQFPYELLISLVSMSILVMTFMVTYLN